MTADLSPAERATVERFDAAPDAEESLRERVARRLWLADVNHGELEINWATADEWRDAHPSEQKEYRRLADVAIAVMRGEQ